jgi:thymidylate kinase/NTP pyrophosphatase (non-canonical NTP hydrolase)
MKLEDLSRFQSAFDKSRGIADLPYAKGQAMDDALSRLEYGVIGLIGEVGEIANLIKKARRGQALGLGENKQLTSELSGEVADALSYLLKLAAEGGINPSKAYLEKMCRNAHRFHANSRPATITIAGPPGSGKTTVASSLSNVVGAESIYIERPANNPFLDRLDSLSTQFDAGASQGWFLKTIAKFVHESVAWPLVLDQDPTAIAVVYGGLLHDQGYLTSADYEQHLGALLTLEIDAAARLNGRVVLLLDAPPSQLASRCLQKRTPLDEAFLGTLRERFLATFADLPNVVMIDTDRALAEVMDEVTDVASRVLASKL